MPINTAVEASIRLPAEGRPEQGGAALEGRYARLACRYGRTGLAAFLTAPGLTVVELAGGDAAAGYAARRGWAVTVGDVVAPTPLAEQARCEYLQVLAGRGLRPALLAVDDATPYRRRGFAVSAIADEAIIDLPTFDLAGPARANLRHSIATAGRQGLTVTRYDGSHAEQLAEVSAAWLATKRGGEYELTLSRHADIPAQLRDGLTDVWLVADQAGRAQAWCSWRHYRAGAGRLLDVMRRRPDAPNPAMDLLLATTLANYRAAGLTEASLAGVPRAPGRGLEWVFPSQTLRAYKQKFVPSWQPRWLAVPARRQLPFALAAIGGAYCPDGLLHALRPNH